MSSPTPGSDGAAGRGLRWQPGARIGPWLLEAELGRGGMGAVFRARGPDGAPVALKLLAGEAAARATSQARFQREGQLLRGLRHAHLVGLVEASSGPPPWIAMELVDGQSLEALLRAGPLAPARAARAIGEAALGLAEAHARGLVHRDLKPGNVLLRARDGSAVVADFGLARGAEVERLTRTGALLGTPAYMSPEQVRGEEAGPPSDVWSLGATLYACLTGQDPFRGQNLVELLGAIQAADPPRPGALRPGIPPDLEAACLACLQADPARRPTARALAQGLLRARPAPGAPRVALGLAGALVLAGGLAALWALGPPGPPPPAGAAAVPSRAPPLPPAGEGWTLVWSQSPAAAVPLPGAPGVWEGARVDPLALVRSAAPGARLEGFLGPAEALGQGRVRVRYEDLARALRVDAQRGGAVLGTGPPSAARPQPDPERPGAVRLLSANDTGSLDWALGRARWAELTLALDWRLVESVDSDQMAILHEEGQAFGFHLDGRAGLLSWPGSLVRWTPDGSWHALRMAFGPDTMQELALDGVPRPAGRGAVPHQIRLRVAEAHLGLAEVVVEGRPLRLDLPALAGPALELPPAARLAVRWRRVGGAGGAGGPLLALVDAASPLRHSIELELDARELLLRSQGRVVERAELPAEAPGGVLVLERRGDTLCAEAHPAGGVPLRLEVQDPLPSGAATLRALWGSLGAALEVEGVEVHTAALDPERQAWDRVTPGTIERPATPEARWRAAAADLVALTDVETCPDPYVGTGRRQASAARLAAALEAEAPHLDPVRRADALARAVQARVVARQAEQAELAARRAVEALGQEAAAARVDALERRRGRPALLTCFLEGYECRQPEAEEAGLRAAGVLRPEWGAQIGLGLAVADRGQGRALLQRGQRPEGQARLERALGRLERAAALGTDPVRVRELRSELLLDLRRAEAALPLWLARVGSGSDRDFAYAWRRLAECLDLLGRQCEALEARLAGVALQPRDVRDRQGLALVEEARRLLDGDPVQRAVAAAALDAVAAVLDLSAPRAEARQAAATTRLLMRGREADLCGWVLVRAGLPYSPDGERPSATLARAAAGDAAARAGLRGAADQDPLVRHLALLDPVLAPLVR